MKTKGGNNAKHDLRNRDRSSSSSRSNPWERVCATFGPLRKGMNILNDCLLSVSGPLGKGNLLLDPWERVGAVQVIVCSLFLGPWEKGTFFWTIEKGYEQFKWLFAFCFWAIGKGKLVFWAIGKGYEQFNYCLLSVSHASFH